MESTLTYSYAQDLLTQAENQLSGIANPEPWLVEAMGGSTSSSGVRVSTDTVLGLPAAWRSIDLICNKLGSMPVEVQRKNRDEAWEDMPGHPVERLLNRNPHQLYTPLTFRQTVTLHALLEGNGRAYIYRGDDRGEPESLTIMQPKQTYTIVINGSKYHVVFFTRDQYGDVLTPEVEAAMRQYGQVPISTGNGSFFTIPDSSVLHIPGLSYNGLWGLPLVSVARDIFGIDQAAHEAVSYQFNNGGRPSLLLTAPRGLFPTEKQAREYMAQFRAKHEGTRNQGKVGMLREGMSAEYPSAGNTFAGLSDLTSASKSDIALLFGTEYLLGEISAVYKDLESRMNAFHQNTLDRWAEVWEQEGGRKLLNRQRYLAGTLRLHLDPSKILRGTPNSLADYTGKLRTQGLISGNEGRAYHNQPPVEGLDDDYGNPAISTPETLEAEPEEPEESGEESAADVGAEARGNRAIERHFVHMLKHEKRRVTQAAKEPAFFDRLTKFYDEFEAGLVELCSDLMIDTKLAVSHCEQSKTEIVNLAGSVPPDALHDQIKTLVSDWETRHENFTDCCSATS